MRRMLIVTVVVVLALALLPPLLAPILGWVADPSLLPPHERTVELADGRTLHYRESGEGTPVVLIHGLPGNSGDWRELQMQLNVAGPYRVIAYDRVGYGYSTRAASDESGYTFDSNADELGALLDALEIERAVLVGWSYGGGVALRYAELHPDRVSHVVLVGSAGPGIPPREATAADLVMSSPAPTAVLAWIGSIPPLSRAVTRGALVQAFALESAIPDGFVDYTRASLALPGTRHAMVRESQRDDPSLLRPSRVAQPSLVVHGADDYVVPFSVGEDLDAKLPESSFVPVLSGSHMLPITHPELLGREIHEFVGAY